MLAPGLSSRHGLQPMLILCPHCLLWFALAAASFCRIRPCLLVQCSILLPRGSRSATSLSLASFLALHALPSGFSPCFWRSAPALCRSSPGVLHPFLARLLPVLLTRAVVFGASGTAHPFPSSSCLRLRSYKLVLPPSSSSPSPLRQPCRPPSVTWVATVPVARPVCFWALCRPPR